jgi:hypothetical protein
VTTTECPPPATVVPRPAPATSTILACDGGPSAGNSSAGTMELRERFRHCEPRGPGDPHRAEVRSRQRKAVDLRIRYYNIHESQAVGVARENSGWRHDRIVGALAHLVRWLRNSRRANGN